MTAPQNVLVDTNVLVYAYDHRDASKQARALRTLDHLARAGSGKLSTQVLGEFVRVVTEKLDPPLTIPQARRALFAFVRIWPVVPVTPIVVLHAVQGLVLSEDFQDGRRLDGVEFRNPFAPAFDLAQID